VPAGSPRPRCGCGGAGAEGGHCRLRPPGLGVPGFPTKGSSLGCPSCAGVPCCGSRQPAVGAPWARGHVGSPPGTGCLEPLSAPAPVGAHRAAGAWRLRAAGCYTSQSINHKPRL